jgi:diguanylate cyclase (GGDEF)-like protein
MALPASSSHSLAVLSRHLAARCLAWRHRTISRRLAVWASGALVLALLWAALYLGTLAQARQRHVQLADALMNSWLQVGGTPLQRAATLALATEAKIQLLDDTGQPISAHDSPSHRRVPDIWLARRLAPAEHAETRPVAAGPDRSLQLQVLAPVDDLWRMHLLGAALLLACGVGGLALSQAWSLQQRRRLKAAVATALAQARSLGESGYVGPQQAGLPELVPLAEAMDRQHQRMRALFEVHAEQLEALRRQAHSDAVTGLPNRRHFLAVLEALLSGDSAPAEAGLVLLRLADLQGMNQRLGARVTDQVLKALAEVLETYQQRSVRCAVGRLTGGDFALLLPTGGVSHETAQALLQALRRQLARVDPLARVSAGAVELRPPLGSAQALVMAQAALAGAESADAARMDAVPAAPAVAEAAAGPGATPKDTHDQEIGWQRQLARALVQGRVALAAYPVCTPDGRQLLLDSPLRVQLQPGGAYEPAARWLAQAHRSRLNAAVDEKAIALALSAIADDGRARCVNISAVSALSAEFVAAVTRRLAGAPGAASQLWLDLPEPLALERPDLVRELARRWRPLGAMLALEHCGEGLLKVPRLMDLGLDCVRIDGRFVNGVAAVGAEPARQYLQGLVKLVQSVGLSVTAEAVRCGDDLELLWHMGFDAATGPALTREPTLA